MANKKKSSTGVKAEATAKAELVAKATYQRKHTVTEVVPADVTRAKAGAWLDLISPITAWAGLKGDALRFKRGLLRIQQEETLHRVAQQVRERVAGERTTAVPPKILVPALEKASLESPEDDTMVRRWAELLASAAQELNVQPRFVSILGELAGRQARCLDLVAFNNFDAYTFPDVEIGAAPYNFAEHAFRSVIEARTRRLADRNSDTDALIDYVVSKLQRPGVSPELVMVHIAETDDWYSWDSVQQTGMRSESDFAILESLGLVRRAAVEFSVELPGPERSDAGISIYYHHLTQLGLDFCEVCSRSEMKKLQAIGDASRARGARRKKKEEI